MFDDQVRHPYFFFSAMHSIRPSVTANAAIDVLQDSRVFSGSGVCYPSLLGDTRRPQ